jgi:MoaA/NifB/PqqE/SkfB family radical SAM enzyme
MTLSYDLLQLSFQNNSTIEKVKKSLRLAAKDGLISCEIDNIEQEEVSIIIAYLKDEGIKLWNYNKYTKSIFVSWVTPD